MAQVSSVLPRIDAAPLSVDACEQVLSFARQPQLTEYDAAYLELALRESTPPRHTRTR